MSALLAIVTTVSIVATMKALLTEDDANEIKYEAQSARLAFNAKMRANNVPGYWPTV